MKNTKRIFIATVASLMLLTAGLPAFAWEQVDEGWSTVKQVKVEADGDTFIWLNAGGGWYKLYQTQDFEDKLVSIALTAMATGREILLDYDDANGDGAYNTGEFVMQIRIR